jgi:hypothetical protein
LQHPSLKPHFLLFLSNVKSLLHIDTSKSVAYLQYGLLSLGVLDDCGFAMNVQEPVLDRYEVFCR